VAAAPRWAVKEKTAGPPAAASSLVSPPLRTLRPPFFHSSHYPSSLPTSNTQGAHTLTLLLSLFNAAAALAVLIGARNKNWASEYGWVGTPGGDRLKAALGVPAQVFGALTGAALIIAAAAALYLINATLLFFRGWYEAAAAAGGRRAGLPAFAVGSNLLVWAGVFQGLASRAAGVSGAKSGQWGFWLTVASGLAWLLKSHILYRSPPPRFVADVLSSVPSGEGGAGGAGGAASPGTSVRPVIGSLPASLRNSMNRTPGVTVV
jgi:hypothetical protein